VLDVTTRKVPIPFENNQSSAVAVNPSTHLLWPAPAFPDTESEARMFVLGGSGKMPAAKSEEFRRRVVA
jgi:hypothetical protein